MRFAPSLHTMPIYNPKTFVLIASLMTGLMGCVLLLMGPATAQRIPGIRHWVSGSLLTAASGMLIVLRDVAPVWLTYMVQNTVLMIAYVSFLLGSAKHFGQACNFKGWVTFFALLWAVQAYYTYGEDSLRGRYLSITGFIFAASFAHAVVFVREIRRRRAEREPRSLGVLFTAFWVVFSALIFGVRWAHAVLHSQEGLGLLDMSWLQVLYLGNYVFGVVMMNIGFQLLVSERIRGNFETLAMTDALTGVRSRRAVVDAANDLLERSRRSERPFVLMMLDLDYFKSINDKFGHQIGDRVLQAFCRRMDAALRRADVLGRLGGEEFAILLPETGTEHATQLADRLLKAAAVSDSQLPATTVSIGISEWRPDDASVDEILGRADRALYAAKAAGRNQAMTA